MTDLVIFDTNVIIAAFYSKKGPSHKLMGLFADGKFRLALSVPLIMDYEAIMKRELNRDIYTDKDIEDIVDYICANSKHTKTYYLWRPYLKDSHDDHLLELSLASEAKYIVTYNIKDLKKTKDFGKTVITPEDFLSVIS